MRKLYLVSLVLLVAMAAVVLNNTPSRGTIIGPTISFGNISGAGGTIKAGIPADEFKISGGTVDPVTKTIYMVGTGVATLHFAAYSTNRQGEIDDRVIKTVFSTYSTHRQSDINTKQPAGSYALQSTTVNGHALSSNVTVTASDAGAIPLVGNAIVNSGTNTVYRCTGITNTGILTVNSAMCTTGFATTSLKLD